MLQSVVKVYSVYNYAAVLYRASNLSVLRLNYLIPLKQNKNSYCIVYTVYSAL